MAFSPLAGLGGPSGGHPASIPLPQDSGGGGGDLAADFDAVAQALGKLLNDEKDPQDKALISKIITDIHSLQAGRAKEADAAMGTSPAMKFVRRQTQSQQGGGY